MLGQLRSSITLAQPDRITVRGFDLARDLIGHTTGTEYFYVLLTGQRPTETQARLLDACITAIAEHGLVPSVQVARMTYASAPEALQGAVSAGLLGCGSVILGSSEMTGRLLSTIVSEAAGEKCLRQSARDQVSRLRAEGRTVPGIGHPLHRVEDPRATALMTLANELGATGQHSRALEEVIAATPEFYGRAFPMNASGAIAAVLLDVEFPVSALKGIPLLGRTMSLVAHLLEEELSPIGFGLADVAAAAVEYVHEATGETVST